VLARGPQRICVPGPARAGCAEITDRGMRSNGAAVPSVVVVGGTNRDRAPLGARKIVLREERVGRRVGREEKALGLCERSNPYSDAAVEVTHLVVAASVLEEAAPLVARRQVVAVAVAPKSEERNWRCAMVPGYNQSS
jgi:hypothetical protein